MPNAGKVDVKEQNNYKQGRSGGETMKKEGIVGSPKHNPTNGGGINRATQGKGSAG